ncbi:sn-glycerol-3-phosphate ABC transporter ATP-binding protein UgpC [Devosia sp. BK]|uniref:ABC transporter ATP-binding protein n=1 Tax=Devosia sp. BK TaxID=2871706 RepID=UPI002939EABE|nr:sn-glycerol-3-phosphate ABC transporter ATP-binding protein UgpC [Devosia sp. BK]MDV3253766.1 sn-glycerol-3-phosphate ABC transporter ATP-binding protein UgpC [Devosia sp. BK]
MAHVTLRKIVKKFGSIEVIKGVDLDVEDQKLVVFVGPSGCGKSTLLRLIAGLEDISSGELTIGGELVNEVPPSDRGISMVFQSYALFPHMNVFDNMAFGLKLAKTPKSEIDSRVRDAARILKLEELLDRKPRSLSGGQRQRVAIGRAIVRQPKVFLFDEPLSNLDAALRVSTRVEIANLHKQLKATIIYVTHDQVEAMTLADQIVVLNEGRVEQVGSPLELYHYPNNQFVAGFIGSPKMNFLPVIADYEGGMRLPDGRHITLPRFDVAGHGEDSLVLGIRPEHSGFTPDAKGEAMVRLVERLGGETMVYAEYFGADFVIKLTEDRAVAIGDRILPLFEADKCHIFDSRGLAIRPLAES